ncbi:MAG: hypothetical protein ACHQQ3_00015 [Gemmatimonadales bacterium]
MSINRIGTPDTPIQAVRPARDAEASVSKNGAKPVDPQAARRDSVELSFEGRTRASSAGLSSERIDQIRQNIQSGVYDSTHVLDSVAKKILKSGDL